MMRFIASTEVFHLVLITEVALPPPIFSLFFSLSLLFSFDRGRQSKTIYWKAKRLSSISVLRFFFLFFGTYKLARSGIKILRCQRI